MSRTFDCFTTHHPGAGRWILTAATLCVLIAPAAILTVASGHTAQSRTGMFAGIGFCLGYAAATLRFGRRSRSQIAAARRDPLTGLPNRAAADDMLNTAARRRIPMTVALADVDGLHALNANLGHVAGDQYISVIAARLSQAVPPHGCLVRQGGDEFTLVAPDIDPEELATRIGAALSGPATIAGYRIQPRASVGIATSGADDPNSTPNPNHARARADVAMYTAKAAGGNHIHVFDPNRDGEPEPDGTRPLVRRRDVDPLAAEAVAWLPVPGEIRTPHDPDPTSAVPAAVSAAFTPTDIDLLVITAAQAVCGDQSELSTRQRELAARAYALLRDRSNGDAAPPSQPPPPKHQR